jgi:glycosyltransferase involved in cell wall biosynthesis
MNICIVTDDILGPVRNGGIGTAYGNLAEFLKGQGHDITILYAPADYCEQGTIAEWIQDYATRGIKFVPAPTKQVEGGPPYGHYHLAKAYNAYLWLKKMEEAGSHFDVIHYHDWCAPGFFIAQARKQGLHFQKTRLICGTHAPDKWAAFGNRETINNTNRLEVWWMERKSAEWADVVVSPSRYMLDWYEENGAKFSETQDIRVIQNLIPQDMIIPEDKKTGREEVKEFVFFGRLEVRKGFIDFCSALDWLANDKDFDYKGKIVFMGKDGVINGQPVSKLVPKLAERWPWKIEVISNFDRDQAVEYLSQPGRVAVIASRTENSPYTVLECLARGIHFIARDVGGIRELVTEEDCSRVLFPNRVEYNEIGEALKKSFINGTKPATMRETQEHARELWSKLHEVAGVQRRGNSIEAIEMPFINVIVTTRNRPNLLRQALASLEAQTYLNFSVTVFDSGSDMPGHLKMLSALEQRIVDEQKNWQVIRNPVRLWPDMARNTAFEAVYTPAGYVMFMDDDNVAKPNELETMVQVAKRTDADVVTCSMDVFLGEDPPVDEAVVSRWIPIGPCVSAGAWRNVCGDTNALWKMSAFKQIGGFSNHWGVGHEDWELYSKAALENYHIEAIPDALFFYRDSPDGVNKSAGDMNNFLRSYIPYLEKIKEVHPELEDFALFAHSNKFVADRMSNVLAQIKERQKQGP